MLVRWEALVVLTVFLASLEATGQEYGGLYDLDELREAVVSGPPESQELALQALYARLHAGPDMRDETLPVLEELAPYVQAGDARAEYQQRLAETYRDAGDYAQYDLHLRQMEEENPDPATEWGYHAKYVRVFEHLQGGDYAKAAAVLEPLLPYSEGMPGNQRGRLGVQLTNVYRNNGDFDKAIALGELTRSKLDLEDSRLMDLLGDIAASYFETENFELAALTYDELAATAARLRPDAQPPDRAADIRHFAPLKAALARELAATRQQVAKQRAQTGAVEAVPAVTAPMAPRGQSEQAPATPVKPVAAVTPAPVPDAHVVSGGARWLAAVLAIGALLCLAVLALSRRRQRHADVHRRA